MKNNARTLLVRSTALYLACAIAASGPGMAQAQRGRPSREPVTLNFVNAEIEAVARTMAAITGRNIVVDPRVKGTINLSTEKPVPPNVAYNQFLTALRLSGFTIVESQGLLKLVPEADAKLQAGAVSVGSPAGGAQMVTQIFRLNYEPAGNLVPILRPLISPNNTINVNPGNNSLIITDYADNLQRIGRIIAALDVSNATDVDVIPLQNVLAADVAPVVQRLIDASGATGAATGAPPAAADSSFRTTIIAESRSNSLLVRAANPARLSLVRSLVQKLDQPSGQSAAGNIWVVYLRNADATRLAVTLRAALAALSPTGGGAAAAGGGAVSSAAPIASPAGAAATATGAASPQATAPTQPVAQVSTGGQIQADPATNALIITAPEPQYRQIRAVIDQLDSRRAQVYVESLVAEVSEDKVGQFGIQWQTNLNNTNSSTVGVIGTNFSSPPQNIISLATQPGGSSSVTLPSTGLNFGTFRQIAGRFVLTSIANFLQTTGDGNILATPTLLTLDNEEAKIVVGQNVPFITGQFTNTGAATGSVNPFQTIERRDVGLTLRVRPQVSENGTIKMQIFEEVSSIDPTSVNSPQGLITNKRSLESSILVDDGAIVVLGGLLQDNYSGSQQKVPGLGDVPFLGALFKTQNRERKKDNLMVFLRPVVIRDSAQSDALSLDRYDLMRGAQIQAQPPASLVTPVNESAIMPPAAPPTPVPPSVPGPGPAPGPATPPSSTPPTSGAAPASSRPVAQQSAIPPPLGR